MELIEDIKLEDLDAELAAQMEAYRAAKAVVDDAKAEVDPQMQIARTRIEELVRQRLDLFGAPWSDAEGYARINDGRVSTSVDATEFEAGMENLRAHRQSLVQAVSIIMGELAILESRLNELEATVTRKQGDPYLSVK